MKIRNGYVSNSSSSSFMILGIIVPKSFNELDEASHKIDRNHFILDIRQGLDDYGSETVFIGATPYKMNDNETLLNFKKRIVKELDFCGFNVKTEDLKWFSDSGRI